MALRDSIGAALSATSMLIFGILLPNLLGLPILIATVLVTVAFGFCVHSFLAFKKMSESASEATSKALLRRIAWLNLAYLIATTSIVVILWNDLTLVGRLFLIAEGLILLPLSLYELRFAK